MVFGIRFLVLLVFIIELRCTFTGIKFINRAEWKRVFWIKIDPLFRRIDCVDFILLFINQTQSNTIKNRTVEIKKFFFDAFQTCSMFMCHVPKNTNVLYVTVFQTKLWYLIWFQKKCDMEWKRELCYFIYRERERERHLFNIFTL